MLELLNALNNWSHLSMKLAMWMAACNIPWYLQLLSGLTLVFVKIYLCLMCDSHVISVISVTVRNNRFLKFT